MNILFITFARDCSCCCCCYATGCTQSLLNPCMRRGVTVSKSKKINWRIKMFLS